MKIFAQSLRFFRQKVNKLRRLPHKRLAIAGCRGIPGRHGGFETFAEALALYLAEKDWEVLVYCQRDELRHSYTETYRGVTLVNVPIPVRGPLATVLFDLWCMLDACFRQRVLLLLGYNTAVFAALAKLSFIPLLVNMDGFEWKRQKWGRLAKLWLKLNEAAATRIANTIIADHPSIERYYREERNITKVAMIPYGAHSNVMVDKAFLEKLDLLSGEFSVVIARPEPENSILEIVAAFSESIRHHKLVVLGDIQNGGSYCAQVMKAASTEVVFAGPIYDSDYLAALRSHALYYLHGHQVGGTNPALVEALACGCAVIAHDNEFNRWVTASNALFFSSQSTLSKIFDGDLHHSEKVNSLKTSSRQRFENRFKWERVLGEYEDLLNGNSP